MKNSLVAFLCLFLSLSSGTVTSQNIEKAVDQLLDSELKDKSPGSSVLISKDNRIIYNKSFGKANLELDVHMTPNSVYRIASLSKQFTAIAILKLVEDGKISLNQDIKTYLKNYPLTEEAITIEHLLTHTSGIKDYLKIDGFNQRVDMSPGELINFFKKESLDFSPGKAYSYSSSGYVLLGHIIETVSGLSYADFIKQNIFEPLNLSNSYYEHTSSIIENRVSGYRNDHNRYLNADFLSMTLPYSAGSLLSTVEDLNLWNNALTKNGIITSSMLEKAYTPYKLLSGKTIQYGYGWEIGNVQGVKAVKHSGRINGFSSYALSIPEKDIYVVILTNTDGIDNLDNITSKLAAITINKPYRLEKIAVSKKEKESLNGIYENSNGTQKIVRFEDEELLIFDRGKTKNKLIANNNNSFFLENALTTFVVEKENDNIFLIENNTTQINRWKRIDDTIKSLDRKPIQKNNLEKFVGDFELGPDFYFKVKIENNTLIGQIENDKKELIFIGNQQFIAKDVDAEITFNFDENNEVKSLTLNQGREMTAKKID